MLTAEKPFSFKERQKKLPPKKTELQTDVIKKIITELPDGEPEKPINPIIQKKTMKKKTVDATELQLRECIESVGLIRSFIDDDLSKLGALITHRNWGNKIRNVRISLKKISAFFRRVKI